MDEHLSGCENCRTALDATRSLVVSAQAHIPIGVLVGFAEQGQISDFDPSLFDQHLVACDECSQQLQFATESFQAMPAESVVPVFEDAQPGLFAGLFQSIRLWRFAAAAATVLLLLSGGALLVVLRSQQDSDLAYAGQQKELRERINELQVEKEQRTNELSNIQRESEQAIEELKNRVTETEDKLKESEKKQDEQPPRVSGPTGPRQGGQANVVALDVFPTSVYRSGSANENLLVIPNGAQSATLILNSASDKIFKRYSIELVSASGRMIWNNSDLKRYGANDFTISLPASLLTNGRYAINIYGVENGERTKTESFQISITRQ